MTISKCRTLYAVILGLGLSACTPLKPSSQNQVRLSEMDAVASLSSDGHTFGMNIDDPGPKKTHFDRAVEGKFPWVRIWFWWKWMEQEKGKINWSNMDAQVAWAKKRGFRIYGTVTSIPYWANGSRQECNFWNDSEAAECSRPWPSDSKAYVDFLRKVVQRYKNDIEIWNPWNEPNLKTFWAGSINDYVGLVLWPAYQIIKSEAPEALVAGPELASLGNIWWRDIFGIEHDVDWKRWLRDILRFRNPTTGRPPMDILSQHTYENSALAVAQTIDAIRQVAVKNGGGHLPIWMTETAFNDCKLGTDRQLTEARELVRLAQDGRRSSYWKGTFYFGMAENEEMVSKGQCGALVEDKPGFPAKPVLAVFTETLPGTTPHPDFSAWSSEQRTQMMQALRHAAETDGWVGGSDGEGPRLGSYGWNYYLEKIIGGFGVDLGTIKTNEAGFDLGQELSIGDWWSKIEDYLRPQ